MDTCIGHFVHVWTPVLCAGGDFRGKRRDSFFGTAFALAMCPQCDRPCRGRPGFFFKIGGHMAEKKKAEKETAASTSAFDCLAVTQVTVWPFQEGQNLGHMKGLAQIVLNDQMVVRGLRVMDGEHGLFVGYPNDPFYKGEDFRTLCNPITRQLKEHIENCVLEKYQASIAAQ